MKKQKYTPNGLYIITKETIEELREKQMQEGDSFEKGDTQKRTSISEGKVNEIKEDIIFWYHAYKNTILLPLFHDKNVVYGWQEGTLRIQDLLKVQASHYNEELFKLTEKSLFKFQSSLKEKLNMFGSSFYQEELKRVASLNAELGEHIVDYSNAIREININSARGFRKGILDTYYLFETQAQMNTTQRIVD